MKIEEFQRCGIKVMDSLHLAVAEVHGIDVLLTTDDSFLRATKRVITNIAVANPVVLYYYHDNLL